jgi:uncharacterized protein YecA (UPF0149 family)
MMQSSAVAVHQHVQSLLCEYQCPYQFHEVRASFMGAIASPYVVDPLFELNALWDGEFPELDSQEKLDEVTKTFLEDFWGLLAEHASDEAVLPFMLTPLATATSLAEIKTHAQLRGEELDAFLTGFFQDQESLELDEEVGESLDILEELVLLLTDMVNMNEDTTLDASELSDLADNLLKMTDMAELEMNNLIVSCG